MVRTSKTQNQREVARSPGKPRFKTRLFEGMKVRAKAKANKLKNLAIALGIGVMVSCTPATLSAQDTAKRSPNTPAGAVSQAPVSYETFSDPKELEPFFTAAKDKLIPLKNKKGRVGYETKDFKFWITATSGINIDIIAKKSGDKKTTGFGTSGPNEMSAMVVDVGEDNPVAKGEVLIFSNNTTVWMYLFDKKLGTYSLAGVPLEEGKMRRGPINTGFAFNEDGGFVVINSPKNLKPGDVVCQADMDPNGATGNAFYIFAPDKPEGTVVAMR